MSLSADCVFSLEWLPADEWLALGAFLLGFLVVKLFSRKASSTASADAVVASEVITSEVVTPVATGNMADRAAEDKEDFSFRLVTKPKDELVADLLARGLLAAPGAAMAA